MVENEDQTFRKDGPKTDYRNTNHKSELIGDFEKIDNKIKINKLKSKYEGNEEKVVSFCKILFEKRKFDRKNWKGIHDEKKNKQICKWIEKKPNMKNGFNWFSQNLIQLKLDFFLGGNQGDLVKSNIDKGRWEKDIRDKRKRLLCESIN